MIVKIMQLHYFDNFIFLILFLKEAVLLKYCQENYNKVFAKLLKRALTKFSCNNFSTTKISIYLVIL